MISYICMCIYYRSWVKMIDYAYKYILILFRHLYSKFCHNKNIVDYIVLYTWLKNNPSRALGHGNVFCMGPTCFLQISPTFFSSKLRNFFGNCNLSSVLFPSLMFSSNQIYSKCDQENQRWVFIIGLTVRKGFVVFLKVAFIEIHFNRRAATIIFASSFIISLHITTYPWRNLKSPEQLVVLEQ